MSGALADLLTAAAARECHRIEQDRAICWRLFRFIEENNGNDRMTRNHKVFEFDANFKGVTYPLLFLRHPRRGLLKSHTSFGLAMPMFTTAPIAEKVIRLKSSNEWSTEEIASPEEMIALLARCTQENVAFIAFDSFEPTGSVASVEHIRAIIQGEVT